MCGTERERQIRREGGRGAESKKDTQRERELVLDINISKNNLPVGVVERIRPPIKIKIAIKIIKPSIVEEGAAQGPLYSNVFFATHDFLVGDQSLPNRSKPRMKCINGVIFSAPKMNRQ